MRIREVMITDVVSITPDTTYADAAQLMLEHTLASIPVVDHTGTLLGMLSEKDLFHELYPSYSEYYQDRHRVTDQENYEEVIKDLRSKPISDYMTKNVLVISSDDPVMKAGGLMLSHHIHRLPVLEDGKLIGVVSREDVFSAILRSHLGL